MPRNGSGVYSKPAGTTAVVETTIEASTFNTLIDDIVADLNEDRPVTAGGTGVSTLTANGVLVGAGTSAVTTSKAAPSGDFVGTSDSQTLSNKTLASPAFSGTVSGSGTVPTDVLADGAVTTAKITDANVTTAKIADANVTTAKIADSNVTTAKIADSNVTTAKINDDAVTQAKLADPYTVRCVAHAHFRWNGSSIQTYNSSNVSSIVRNALGKYTITFTNALSTANFLYTVSAQNSGNVAFYGVSQSTTTVEVWTQNNVGFLDADRISVLCFETT